DKGANPEARIVLFKRDDSAGESGGVAAESSKERNLLKSAWELIAKHLGFSDEKKSIGEYDGPAIGLGDVRRMAQQLGSDMQHGLLMNQGEIRASQSVLQKSLVDIDV